LRQAYDYWQDQPGISFVSSPRRYLVPDAARISPRRRIGPKSVASLALSSRARAASPVYVGARRRRARRFAATTTLSAVDFLSPSVPRHVRSFDRHVRSTIEGELPRFVSPVPRTESGRSVGRSRPPPAAGGDRSRSSIGPHLRSESALGLQRFTVRSSRSAVKKKPSPSLSLESTRLSLSLFLSPFPLIYSRDPPDLRHIFYSLRRQRALKYVPVPRSTLSPDRPAAVYLLAPSPDRQLPSRPKEALT
jgi:hypothetical protein